MYLLYSIPFYSTPHILLHYLVSVNTYWILYELSVMYLRSNVVRGTAKCLGGLGANDVLLTHAKISYFDMPIGIQEHVVQFQISIKDSFAMQIK